MKTNLHLALKSICLMLLSSTFCMTKADSINISESYAQKTACSPVLSAGKPCSNSSVLSTTQAISNGNYSISVNISNSTLAQYGINVTGISDKTYLKFLLGSSPESGFEFSNKDPALTGQLTELPSYTYTTPAIPATANTPSTHAQVVSVYQWQRTATTCLLYASDLVTCLDEGSRVFQQISLSVFPQTGILIQVTGSDLNGIQDPTARTDGNASIYGIDALDRFSNPSDSAAYSQPYNFLSQGLLSIGGPNNNLYFVLPVTAISKNTFVPSTSDGNKGVINFNTSISAITTKIF